MSSAEHEQLLSHSAWVRDLARRLVRDPDLADDLAQEAWLAAMRARWSEVQSPRAWMATVLRRSLRERLRGDERRARREHDSARGEADETDPADVVARAAAHQDVVDAVMDLPEHYRLVVLRRYFDGETPSEIAAATGVPIATVKTRLQRGLAQLRERLDRRHGGDGQAWAVALAPLVEYSPRAAGAAAVPVGAVTAGLVLVPLLALVAFSLFGPWRSGRDVVEPSGVTEVPPEVASVAVAPRAPQPGSERRPVPLAAGVPNGPLDRSARGLELATGPRRPLRVEVRDVDGRLVPDMLVRFESERGTSSAVAVTDGEGLARLGAAAPPGVLDSADAAWSAIQPVTVTELGSRRATLIVAPRANWHGRAVDGAGVGIVGATLAVELPSPAGPGGATEAIRSSQVRTDVDGAFALDAPDAPGAVLRVDAPGRAGLRRKVSELGPLPWTLVLPEVGADAIRGRVVDGGGAPLAAARLARDGREVPLESDGSFAVEGAARNLVAWAPGYSTARVDRAAAHAGELELVLLAAPDLLGSVRDDAGQPVAGALVWDAGAAPVLWEQDLGDVLWLVAQLDSIAGATPVEFPALGPAAVGTGSGWEPVRADGDGRFRLFGDFARARHLVAFDPSTGSMGELPLAAGLSPDVDLVLDRVGTDQRLEGRVIDFSRAPRRGADVLPLAQVLTAEFGGRRVEVGLVSESGLRSDGGGWFRMARPLPVAHHLMVVGGGALPRRTRLSGAAIETADEPVRALRGVELASWTAAGVELGPGWPEGTRFEPRESDGDVLPVGRRRGAHVEWWLEGVPSHSTPRTVLTVPTVAAIRIESPGVEARTIEVLESGLPLAVKPR